jgi:S1-C subfamily serine protease
MLPLRRERSEIIKTIKKVMPAVVSITVRRPLKEVEEEFKKLPKPKRGTKYEMPADKVDSRNMVDVGGGSGFIADKAGYILTNKHILSDSPAEYWVTLSNDEYYNAEIVAKDPINDIAILKIEAEKSLPYVTVGNSKDLELGQRVLAFGNALGLFRNTVSEGIISGLSRSVTAQADGDRMQELRGLIQTDAAINPGNSGGPLTDLYGQVIGINAAMVSGAENISFALPIKSAQKDLEDLRKYGRIRRPLLGIRYANINNDVRKKFNLSIEHGAIVTKEHSFDKAVIDKSPAAEAGILEGDIILAWNGERLTDKKGIPDFLENSEVGETITLAILRNQEPIEFELRLTERK